MDRDSRKKKKREKEVKERGRKINSKTEKEHTKIIQRIPFIN